jgi:hypothetical protein
MIRLAIAPVKDSGLGGIQTLAKCARAMPNKKAAENEFHRPTACDDIVTAIQITRSVLRINPYRKIKILLRMAMTATFGFYQ